MGVLTCREVLIVDQIVGRCHVGYSNRRVLKYFISRLKHGYKGWFLLTRNERRRWMRQVFEVHRQNRELYRYVMGGYLK